jgi:hypothetical protein
MGLSRNELLQKKRKNSLSILSELLQKKEWA